MDLKDNFCCLMHNSTLKECR